MYDHKTSAHKKPIKNTPPPPKKKTTQKTPDVDCFVKYNRIKVINTCTIDKKDTFDIILKGGGCPIPYYHIRTWINYYRS